MGCNATEVKVTVVDDGDGFDTGRLDGSRAGLAGMRERALLARARIDVRSTPGEGTTVELTLPARGMRAS
jgi:two-component system sensor histidine kinase UhpB